MKTVSLPQWKLVSHSNFEKHLAGEIREVFTECHLRAQVMWDRDGPCVVFQNQEDANTFKDHSDGL